MIKMLAREGEWGFVHIIAVGHNLSAAYSSAEIHYKKPDGTVTDKTCDSVSAADGDFGYTVENAFLDQVGRWEAQLTVTFTGVGGKRKLKSPIVFWIGHAGTS